MDIEKAAELAVRKCLGVRPDESVLVVTDDFAAAVGEALYRAAAAVTPHVFLIKMPETGEQGAEPSKIVANLMLRFDVVICPTKYSLTHTVARKKACEHGARIATLPGITPEIFRRSLDVDYEKMRKEGAALEKALRGVQRIKITTPSGTNLFLAIGRNLIQDAGVIEKPGDYHNLPGGEVFTAPLEGKSEGIIVIDHMNALCKPKTKVIVRRGRVTEVLGDDAFAARMRSAKNADNIAEFGIGINPKAVLSGVMLEDEKVAGTCHIGFGSSFGFGGRVKAAVHWDAVLLRPTIFADACKIVDDGELLV